MVGTAFTRVVIGDQRCGDLLGVGPAHDLGSGRRGGDEPSVAAEHDADTGSDTRLAGWVGDVVETRFTSQVGPLDPVSGGAVEDSAGGVGEERGKQASVFRRRGAGGGAPPSAGVLRVRGRARPPRGAAVAGAA